MLKIITTIHIHKLFVVPLQFNQQHMLASNFYPLTYNLHLYNDSQFKTSFDALVCKPDVKGVIITIISTIHIQSPLWHRQQFSHIDLSFIRIPIASFKYHRIVNRDIEGVMLKIISTIHRQCPIEHKQQQQDQFQPPTYILLLEAYPILSIF